MNNTVLKYLKNAYIKHIFLALLTIIILLIATGIFLDKFTRHGSSMPLPDFKGKTLDSVLVIAKQHKLRIEITDSVFKVDLPKGIVLEQNPEAGFLVKKNRKVFLTVNSSTQKKEMLPNVIGLSLRQAKTILYSREFKVGRLTYDASDFATNNVLQQLYRGSNIEPGLMLPVGEYIDLKLGLDPESYTAISVPDVAGKSRFDAESAIIENSLNYLHVFDRNIKTLSDSLYSVVYRQDPEAGFKSYYGNDVKIWLKKGKIK